MFNQYFIPDTVAGMCNLLKLLAVGSYYSGILLTIHVDKKGISEVVRMPLKLARRHGVYYWLL
jgi:hypothetical protein